MTKPIKLSRAQITEGLKQTPIEQILLGSANLDKVKLTKKQKDFARKVAEGTPKAKAYRETYNSTGKPTTEAVEGSKLASNPKIAQMISAFTVANEAREYLLPAQIRTMAIQNLVSIAIDGEEKTSNKLKALELIGKMSEVSLFSETKTHVHLHNSVDIKEKLLEGLRLAFTNSVGINDLAKEKAQSLLIELADDGATIDEEQTPDPSEIDESADPPDPDPEILSYRGSETMHSIPLKESSASSIPLKESLAFVTPPADEVTIPLESDTCVSIGNYPNKGEGVIDDGQSLLDDLQADPPVNVSNEKA